MGKGTVRIHNKDYKTVALRVSEFREQCPISAGWCLSTEIIHVDDDRVIVAAHIIDPEQHIVAVGHAEEYRDSSKINKTSALENAETSAVGRALAAAGLGGEEYASADELINALNKQAAPKASKPKEEQPTETATSVDLRPMLKELSEKIGEENAREWNKLCIKNRYRVDSIDELRPDQSVEYAELIKDRMKLGKEKE